MPVLRLEGIEKTFPGDHAAVAGVDLEVSEGEMVVLLGPSGCGKSTLLRIVAGVEAPTHGRVLIGGQDVTGLPPQRRDVAMVFQNYALYPHMTVRENLAFGLKMRKLGRDTIAARVAEVAESLEIASLLDRRPFQLSGGQRQRVALGRAIARRAKVFLLDEPLSNLDVQLRVTTRMELARLHRSLEVPMLYVTHDQEEAMTLGDRVAVMRAGRVLQIGAPMEIYARPATRFVGGFIGSPRMNFLPARLRRDAVDGARIDAFGAAIDLQTSRGPATAPARRSGGTDKETEAGWGTGWRDVVVGIRPEDIAIVNPAEADVLALVDVVEPLGREILLHVVPSNRQGEPGTELRVLTGAGGAVEAGATLGLRLRRDRIHLFDPTTEERLANSC